MSQKQIALLQNSVGPDRDLNHRSTLEMASKAACNGAQIICTQELYDGFYFCQTENHKYFNWAMSLDDSKIQDWIELAKKYNWQIYDSGIDRMVDLEHPEKNGFKNHRKYVEQIMNGKS